MFHRVLLSQFVTLNTYIFPVSFECSHCDNLNPQQTNSSILFSYPCTSYSLCYPVIINLSPGKYFFECWGSSGGGATNQNGAGGYTSGYIELPLSTKLYLYIGKSGVDVRKEEFSFNGGGPGDRSGGGSTDIRLINGSYDDFESLKSRIMVAGAGGALDSGDIGGAGGGLIGFSSTQGYGQGGTQTTGGNGLPKGTFGKGGGSTSFSNGNGGGGSGYYGGGASTSSTDYGGGGGSSFISGHFGCDSITPNSSISQIYHSGHSYHYSGIYFLNTTMKNGKELMPSPNGPNQFGHLSNGVVKIHIISLVSHENNTCFYPPGHFVQYLLYFTAIHFHAALLIPIFQ